MRDFVIVTFFVFLNTFLINTRGHTAEQCQPWAAKIVSVQGRVEVVRYGEARWQPVTVDEFFCAGDRLRIEAKSRAAVVLPNSTFLRLDEGTTITFTKVRDESLSLLELIEGAVHFITREPRVLEIKTPFVNGAVEGTEFTVRVRANQAAVWVFEGRVRLTNPYGSLVLSDGEAAVAEAGRAPLRRLRIRPREAVQWSLYYPPIVDTRRFKATASDTVRQAIGLYLANDLPGAIAKLDSVSAHSRDARFYILRAALLVSVGRVDQARSDIDEAKVMDPSDGDAHALQSIIALVRNEPEKALKLALQATALSPQSSVSQIALSYAHQGHFDIAQALVHARKAVDLNPDDALAWARLAEVQLSLGDLETALASARKAAELDPTMGRTQRVLGFAYLTQFDVNVARTAFEKAIERDSSAPLARLGLGLARIRAGELDEGTREIEVAASLDPENALIRSYLGKAYFEQKRPRLAAVEYARAKALDPEDPTPWFYSAILKQTENRPVEALQDLQKAIELNDNRAVYRSRLLLDQDLAARSASLARIYNDLGFDQRALVEGWKSLNIDPSNYSAHRLLADSYARRPRHEIARVSELLQSQLLQPLNINALQPQLAEADLQILQGAGPSALSFNEFNPLFMRDRLALQLSGAVGNNSTWGNDLVVSGLKGPLSISAGQFHYETDGFRANNDLKHDIYNVFAQAAMSPKFSLQAEYRKRETKQGDLELRFDPEDFSEDNRNNVDQDVVRVGGRFAPASHSDVLLSGIYARRDEALDLIDPARTIRPRSVAEGGQIEAQYIFRHDHFNVIFGGGRYDIDNTVRTQIELPAPMPSLVDESKESMKHDNVYLYTNIAVPSPITWTVGVSYDDFEQGKLRVDEIKPKLGMKWDITGRAQLRLAYIETVKRSIVTNQTVEPTQVAGFNQFFDNANGTDAKRYGAGLDTLLLNDLYGGFEISRRDLVVPINPSGDLVRLDRREDLYRAYLYWTPHSSWSFTTEADFERFKRSASDPLVKFGGVPSAVDTVTVPLAIRYFHPNGLFTGLGGTFVHQELDLSPLSDSSKNSDDFFLVDASFGYRLPKRWGIISLEGRNLLDEKFFYQDLNSQTASTSVAPRFIPDRTLLLRATFSFN